MTHKKEKKKKAKRKGMKQYKLKEGNPLACLKKH